jgi:hypothetical protein
VTPRLLLRRLAPTVADLVHSSHRDAGRSRPPSVEDSTRTTVNIAMA